jgi:hypothetical protein
MLSIYKRNEQETGSLTINMRKGSKVPAWLGPLEGTGFSHSSQSSLFAFFFFFVSSFFSLYIILEYVIDYPEACIHFKRNYVSQWEGANNV